VLVKDKPKGTIVGYLAFKDLNIKSNGQIKDIMQTKLAYLNENDNLSQALKAHTDTAHNFFVVLNSADEYVGIVTLSQILNELISSTKSQDKDEHFNREKVAGKYKESKAEELTSSEETTQSVDEVIE
jgi:CBS-domain-containing membrane protein